MRPTMYACDILGKRPKSIMIERLDQYILDRLLYNISLLDNLTWPSGQVDLLPYSCTVSMIDLGISFKKSLSEVFSDIKLHEKRSINIIFFN